MGNSADTENHWLDSGRREVNEHRQQIHQSDLKLSGKELYNNTPMNCIPIHRRNVKGLFLAVRSSVDCMRRTKYTATMVSGEKTC